MLALHGAVALRFGILALAWPGLALLWRVAMFAAYALFGGFVTVVGAIQNRTGDKGWWLILALGLVSTAVGIIAMPARRPTRPRLHPAAKQWAIACR